VVASGWKLRTSIKVSQFSPTITDENAQIVGVVGWGILPATFFLLFSRKSIDK